MAVSQRFYNVIVIGGGHAEREKVSGTFIGRKGCQEPFLTDLGKARAIAAGADDKLERWTPSASVFNDEQWFLTP